MLYEKDVEDKNEVLKSICDLFSSQADFMNPNENANKSEN